MTETSIVSQIVTILVDGVGGIAEGIGGGLSTLASAIFLTSTGTLSVFGTLVVTFAGIALAIGLSRWVLNFVSSMGARNR